MTPLQWGTGWIKTVNESFRHWAIIYQIWLIKTQSGKLPFTVFLKKLFFKHDESKAIISVRKLFAPVFFFTVISPCAHGTGENSPRPRLRLSTTVGFGFGFVYCGFLHAHARLFMYHVSLKNMWRKVTHTHSTHTSLLAHGSLILARLFTWSTQVTWLWHLWSVSGLCLAGATRTHWWCLLWRSNRSIVSATRYRAVTMVKAGMKQVDTSTWQSVSLPASTQTGVFQGSFRQDVLATGLGAVFLPRPAQLWRDSPVR